jgi:hypothetical protein
MPLSLVAVAVAGGDVDADADAARLYLSLSLVAVAVAGADADADADAEANVDSSAADSVEGALCRLGREWRFCCPSSFGGDVECRGASAMMDIVAFCVELLCDRRFSSFFIFGIFALAFGFGFGGVIALDSSGEGMDCD